MSNTLASIELKYVAVVLTVAGLGTGAATDTLIAAIKWKARKEARKARRHEREMELETIALSAKDQLTADDYILPYIDDNDSDLEDDL